MPDQIVGFSVNLAIQCILLQGELSNALTRNMRNMQATRRRNSEKYKMVVVPVIIAKAPAEA
jgi:hypothetical protein